jgi:hypothetical protein
MMASVVIVIHVAVQIFLGACVIGSTNGEPNAPATNVSTSRFIEFTS